MTAPACQAGAVKRPRATKVEMEARATFLIDYATRHGPMTVRGLYYQAEVHGVPGVDKSESGYNKVQALALKLRREGRMPYGAITDTTRFARKPESWNGWAEALLDAVEVYRKDLWADTGLKVDIWVEKSALAGVLLPVTAAFDAPLMCTGGYCSETFAHDAVRELRGADRKLVIYSLYDFDRSGRDAEASLREKLMRFGRLYGVPVAFNPLALTLDQVRALDLPTRPAKKKTEADRRWPHGFAAELDAIPPETIRGIVREALERHMPPERLARLREEERMERETLAAFIEERS